MYILTILRSDFESVKPSQKKRLRGTNPPIAPLDEDLLISQEEARIERYLRQDGGQWLYTAVAGLDARIALSSIECELSLSEVYDKVEVG